VPNNDIIFKIVLKEMYNEIIVTSYSSHIQRTTFLLAFESHTMIH